MQDKNSALTHQKPRPFVKWAGGKRKLIKELMKYVPEFNRYYEPFVGGGAMLFHLHPQMATVNDINNELINAYREIRDSPQYLIYELRKHINDEGYFYHIRSLDRDGSYTQLSAVERASRFIFLNKTCYNGLYRVNKKGQFNAPFGRYKNPTIVDRKNIINVSCYLYLNDINLMSGDYRGSLEDAGKDDFVYFDPPYDPVSNSSNFTGYTPGGFNRDDQERLKGACDELSEKGVKFMLSNSSTDFIRDLYRNYTIRTIGATRSINSKGNKRGKVDEVIITNYG